MCFFESFIFSSFLNLRSCQRRPALLSAKVDVKGRIKEGRHLRKEHCSIRVHVRTIATGAYRQQEQAQQPQRTFLMIRSRFMK